MCSCNPVMARAHLCRSLRSCHRGCCNSHQLIQCFVIEDLAWHQIQGQVLNHKQCTIQMHIGKEFLRCLAQRVYIVNIFRSFPLLHRQLKGGHGFAGALRAFYLPFACSSGTMHASADARKQQPDGTRINSYSLASVDASKACLLADLCAKPIGTVRTSTQSGMQGRSR